MFKSMIIYRIAESWQGVLQALEDALPKTVFAECGAPKSAPWEWCHHAPRSAALAVLLRSS